jgi:uncharacterized protein (DUF305 family)
MKTKKPWPALLAAVALVAVIAAGCGNDDDSGSMPGSSGNETDAAFVADMTTHHQGAIDMAKLAQMKADHAEIRTFADDIITAQEGEIAAMKAVREDMHAMGMHDGGHMGMSEHEMGMDTDMAALERAKPFDKAFIDAMVPHHEGAIAMARTELDNGTQPGLRRMAKDIIGAQTNEIAQLKQWRKAWYGSAKVPTDRSGHGSTHDMDMGSGER